MLVLRDPKALAQADDPWLRKLLAQRTQAILENVDAEFQLHELATFVVLGPGDSREALDRELGFPLDAYEVLEEHPGYYDKLVALDIDLSDRAVFDDRHSGKGVRTPETFELSRFHTASTRCCRSPKLIDRHKAVSGGK